MGLTHKLLLDHVDRRARHLVQLCARCSRPPLEPGAGQPRGHMPHCYASARTGNLWADDLRMGNASTSQRPGLNASLPSAIASRTRRTYGSSSPVTSYPYATFMMILVAHLDLVSRAYSITRCTHVRTFWTNASGLRSMSASILSVASSCAPRYWSIAPAPSAPCSIFE